MENHAPTNAAPRVLIVDDEESVRTLAARVLHRAGYQTAVAADGPEALRIAEGQEPFDLLVADVVMPGMHGDELARRLLRQEPDLKVLYVTGHREQLFAERTTLGANETFLEKPITIPVLIEAVSLALSGRTHRLAHEPLADPTLRRSPRMATPAIRVRVDGMIADPDATDFSGDALAIMAFAHPNVLLIGPVAATDRALTLLRPCVRPPIISWTPHEAHDLPIGLFGTLVIRGIETADRAQQSQLYIWLDGRPGPVQVVATSAAPLFPLVIRGVFDEHLYYRLNQLCFDL